MVADFRGASFGGRIVEADKIVGRELVVAIPPKSTTISQQAVLGQLVQYGRTLGVVVRMEIVK